jgi:DNA-binding transcriptional ArsR family regulator
MLLSAYDMSMARAATTSDVFNAVAEPARRSVLESLRAGEANVSELVEWLGFTQPQVSKHLKVLRDVGLVTSRAVGKERFYRIDPTGLRAMHDWTGLFAAMWNERLNRLDAILADLADTDTPPQPTKPTRKGPSS